MTTNDRSPYRILGIEKTNDELTIRVAFRQCIHDYKQDRTKPSNQRKISPEQFRLMCRAYDTLSDRDKRKHYDETTEWTSHLPFNQYNLRELAAEPEIIDRFKIKVENATLAQLNEKAPITEQTPMYCAARACNIEAVEYLTLQDADPDITQRTGSTALHAAAFFNHPEMIRCLLQCGANYHIKNLYGNLPEAEIGDHPPTKQAFDELKNSAYARVAAGDFDWLQTHLEHSHEHVDHQYYSLRQTLLHCACKKGHFDIVRCLVEKYGADLDIVDYNLNSALHLAAHRGHSQTVEYLLNRGADTTLINNWGFTAEQEGLAHKEAITSLFKKIRQCDPFKMTSEGQLWWFRYHFADRSPDFRNDSGVHLLYVAARYGRLELVQWLLDKGANINAQLQDKPKSTALHGAAYHNHYAVVELLLENNADLYIKNEFGETAFDNATSDEMKMLLNKYRQDARSNRILIVHIFSDGKKLGDAPLVKLQLPIDATMDDLRKAMSADDQKRFPCFSIARRPLRSDSDSDTLVSVFCRSRHGKTKFVDLPLCLTGHEQPRFINSGHRMSDDLPSLSPRQIDAIFAKQSTKKSFSVRGKLSTTQLFSVDDLSFNFSSDCTPADVSFEVKCATTGFNPFLALPGCLLLFRTLCSDNQANFRELPEVTFAKEPDARLYMWLNGSGYWIGIDTNPKRLFMIEGLYALVKHIAVIPSKLSLPGDMILSATLDQPLENRTVPVICQCLKIMAHDKQRFPLIAYHGTNIKVIQSILMDGLVMPSTVVSSGVRVCPPSNHIARGVAAFGIADFSNAIFVSPSIHYCSDPVYAITFMHDDRILIPVLECAVRNEGFTKHKSTVPTYKAHPDDNIEEIEWRFMNPAFMQILSVLFIAVKMSRADAAKLRAEKLGVKIVG